MQTVDNAEHETETERHKKHTRVKKIKVKNEDKETTSMETTCLKKCSHRSLLTH